MHSFIASIHPSICLFTHLLVPSLQQVFPLGRERAVLSGSLSELLCKKCSALTGCKALLDCIAAAIFCCGWLL